MGRDSGGDTEDVYIHETSLINGFILESIPGCGYRIKGNDGQYKTGFFFEIEELANIFIEKYYFPTSNGL